MKYGVDKLENFRRKLGGNWKAIAREVPQPDHTTTALAGFGDGNTSGCSWRAGQLFSKEICGEKNAGMGLRPSPGREEVK